MLMRKREKKQRHTVKWRTDLYTDLNGNRRFTTKKKKKKKKKKQKREKKHREESERDR